jgi:hypothetical protein
MRKNNKTVRRALQHEFATGLSNVKHGHPQEEFDATTINVGRLQRI